MSSDTSLLEALALLMSLFHYLTKKKQNGCNRNEICPVEKYIMSLIFKVKIDVLFVKIENSLAFILGTLS